ncbi:hypothetical protein C7999DRAFT_15765 [Corynascus novoguineensis]|uniref:Fucose-specific lectin n=1 Tax=Corynascus novoguineensis TaxID=1126955 RepID=A0AAN7HLU1_9PEZI|nr:hypothetical protein C7999DRAFT_15765 [Corynascus novoguineensis]
MSSGRDSHLDPYGQQPGLEVVHHPDLEVATPYGLVPISSLPQVQPHEYLPPHDSKEAASTAYGYTSYSDEHNASPAPYPNEDGGLEKKKKRLRWIIIGGVVAVVIIVAAVVGGVVGSRNSSGAQSSGANSPLSTGTNAGAPNDGVPAGEDSRPPVDTLEPPELIRPGSGLSVTGWRMPDGNVETYLFFQDPQDGLRYSRCDTSRRVTGNDSACWAEPVSIPASAKAGTRLAASTALWGDEYQPQIELFYVGGKTRLLGVNLNEQNTPSAAESSVNDKRLFTGLDSGLAAYWPWTIYQDSTGVLYHVRNLLDGSDWSPSDEAWDNNRINRTALVGSNLAIAPTSTNFTLQAVKAGYAVFYQDPDDRLAVSITDIESPFRPSDFHVPWPADDLPDITLPKRAPLAAFSVAREGGEDLQLVDTYVLYLDSNANINVLYTDSTSWDSSDDGASGVVWKTASPRALRSVDRDTDIACLTMATTIHSAAKQEVPLEDGSSGENRCYFQKGGRVVEVRLDRDKQDWVVTGHLPIF